ncbi:hypothetical protein ACTHAM_001872 [Cellulomonas soli]|uniref:DUF7878 domain-containing protein n=1 Tax=Cellulomonas soli TaxID=931535 RepID=UPI003F87667C
MEMTYERLSGGDLRGRTLADLLVSLDARLRVVDGDEVVIDEPGFPVVELARDLSMWLDDPDRGDFEFESMSYEGVGAIAIRRAAAGWEVSSSLVAGAVTKATEWATVARCCRHLIAKVEADLAALGLDSGAVVGR